MRPPRFLLFLLLLVFAASVFAASAPADDDDDDDDDGGSPTLIDSTSGRGNADFGFPVLSTFDFNVTSGPGGENVAGSATLMSVFGNTYSGPATCLRVVGNRAVFEVDNQNPTAGDPRDVVVFVGDFGVGVRVDEFNFDPLSEADAVCPSPQERERSVITGDIVVSDDVPAPRGGDDDDDDGDDEDDDD
jgi:hypothetical protein